MIFKQSRDVVYYIEQIIDDFRSEYDVKPAGILVGPREYAMLCDYCRERRINQDTLVAGLVTLFMDYPVRIKETPGVDLEIPYQLAYTVRY